jgi:hypothetical protein
MRRAIVAALPLGCLALGVLAGCGTPSIGTNTPSNPGALHLITGPTGHVATATLEVTSGTTAVTVSAKPLDGELFRISTPLGSGIRPLATFHGHTVVVGHASTTGGNGVRTLNIALAEGVRWTINLDGGATTETVDMAAGSLGTLNFGAGVSRASVQLPSAKGTESLVLAGGASELSIVAPPDQPAQVDAVGGASQILLDGVAHTGVAGGSVFQDPGWATAVNRYSIDLTAGVSDFQMSRT